MKSPLMIKSQVSHFLPIQLQTKISSKSSSYTNTNSAPCSAKFLRNPSWAKVKYIVMKSHTTTNEETTISNYSHRGSSPKLPLLSSSSSSSSKAAKGNDIDIWIRLAAAAASIGIVVALMMGNEKALALGPEGPLMEEFWENVRRYALYALTVSTGVLYAVFQPIYELLKNPISAILVIIIIGGTLFIGSQILSAMVGVSDFSYDYYY